MRRTLSVFVITALALSSFACSAKKPPEQGELRGKSVLSVLRDLSRSYEKKDLAAFMDAVSQQYPDREDFSKSISDVFSKYEAIRFNIQYTKMVIMIDSVSRARATFTWDAEWQLPGGSVVKDGARVTLVLEPYDSKLMFIEGKNPFIPNPGATPGK
jgi:hypothetical protein